MSANDHVKCFEERRDAFNIILNDLSQEFIGVFKCRAVALRDSIRCLSEGRVYIYRTTCDEIELMSFLESIYYAQESRRMCGNEIVQTKQKKGGENRNAKRDRRT